MLVPLLQQPPQLAAKPAAQILRVNEEDPADWLPDDWMEFLKSGKVQQPQNTGAPGGPNTEQATAAGQPAPGSGPSTAPGTIQGQTGTTPQQAPTIVPGSQMPNISQLMGGKKPVQLFPK